MSNLLGQRLDSLVWGFYDGATVSQDFGYYNPELAGWYQYAANHGWPAGTHIGLDVAMPKYTPIYASEGGTVEHAGFSDYFRPNPVYVREQDGDLAIYGHLWTNAVQTGDKVKRGDLLGTSGEQTEQGTMTPDGSGPHLHFELIDSGGYAIDPTAELTGGNTPAGWKPTTRTGEQMGQLGDIPFVDLPDMKDLGLRAGVILLGVGGLILGFLAIRSDAFARIRNVRKGLGQ